MVQSACQVRSEDPCKAPSEVPSTPQRSSRSLSRPKCPRCGSMLLMAENPGSTPAPYRRRLGLRRLRQCVRDLRHAVAAGKPQVTFRPQFAFRQKIAISPEAFVSTKNIASAGVSDAAQPYCLGIWAAAITFAHFSISARMRASISAGVEAFASMPSSSARFFTSGSASTSCKAALSLSMIACGVPAGAYSAFHDVTSKLATPASLTVGTLRQFRRALR